MALNIKRLGPNGIQIEPVSSSSIDKKGELEVLNTGGVLQYHDGTAVRKVVLDTFNGNISVTGDLTITGKATIDNIEIDGNTVKSVNTDGDIIIDPNGNGDVDIVVSGTGVVNLGSISVTIDASGNMTINGRLDVDNIRIDGNTISSQNTNGDIILDPNGSGNVIVDSLSPSQPVKTNASKALVSGAIDLSTSDVTGVLPVAHGGTGSNVQNFVDLSTNQTISGDKTFNDDIILNSASASLPVKTNASKELVTGAINLASSEVTGVLPIANGGTGSNVQNFVDLSTNQTVGGNKTFQGIATLENELRLKLGTDNSSTGNLPAVSTSGVSVIRFTNNTGPTLQGFDNGAEAKLLIISYTGTGVMIVENESTAATASNRIITGNGQNLELTEGMSLWLYYDSSSSRWRVIGGTGATNVEYNQAACRTDGSGTEVNCSVSLVGGKTRITTTFDLSESTEVFVDGRRYPKYIDSVITPEYFWTQIGTNIVELDADYTEQALPVQVVSFGVKVASNQDQVNQLKELTKYSTDPFVVPQYIAAPHTQITGRRQVLNDNATLSSIYGIERQNWSEITELKDEFGPNGEIVYKSSFDDTERVRFVGGGWTKTISTNGTALTNGTINDFIEITFYGTGLNLLMLLTNVAGDIRARVDGGSEGGNLYASSYSNVLAGRSYEANQILPVVYGLSLGWHTVRIRINAAVSLTFYGCEILNERTDIRVSSGDVFYDGVKRQTTSPITTALTSGFNQIEREGSVVGTLGSRGARVIIYQDVDGSIKKRAYATNSSQQNLTSANHQYEDVITAYNFREFGSGRSDDFQTLTSSSSNRAYTLEDGTTTLVGQGVFSNTNVQSIEGVSLNTTNDFITLTFVGTGLDLLCAKQSTGGVFSYSVTIDGTNVGNISIPIENAYCRVPIVSGLPYGTHTIRITRLTGTDRNIVIRDFIAYGPKEPTLPAGAYKLSEYYILSDFSYSAVTDVLGISNGVIRKTNYRECEYRGTFTASSITPTLINGFDFTSSTASSYTEYEFYGTGVVYRFANNTGAQSFTVAIDGSTDLSGYTTTLTASSGLTLSAATGTVSGSPAASALGNSLRITGLPLGLHTIRITWASGAVIRPSGIDIITPIYFDSNKPNLNKIDIFKQLTSNASIGSGSVFVPILGLSTKIVFKHKSKSKYTITASIFHSGNTTTVSTRLFINGVFTPTLSLCGISTTHNGAQSFSYTVNLRKGTNVIIPYVASDNGATLLSTSNINIVEN